MLAAFYRSFPTQLRPSGRGIGRNLILRKTNWHYYFQAKRYVTNSIPIKKAEKALIRFVETSGRMQVGS